MWGRNNVIFLCFLLTVPPCCSFTDAADSGGPAVHIIHCHPPPPPLVTPRLHTLMSSSEHNLCLPVSSWESPTSKRGIWIIKLLFLAFPLRVTDLTSWSSPTPALLPSLFHSCSLMWTLSSFSPSLSSVHLFCSLQIADLYKKQQQVQNQGEKADPEDYYWLSSAENNK